MEIIITETGEKEELTLIDPKSGVNWINDLMGNHDALPDRNDEGYHLMDQENYDWWADLVTRYQAADNKYHDLLNSLTGDDYDALLDAGQNINVDLENHPEALNAICDIDTLTSLYEACQHVIKDWHSKDSNFDKKEPEYLEIVRKAVKKAGGYHPRPIS